MRLHQFFGVLLGKDPYRIESAPLKLLPKNGYNSYFPLPFQSSCRITLRNTGRESTSVWSMVNWHKYDKQVTLTPYRLHAQFTEEKPAEPLGTTLLGAIRGGGFVAGLIHAVRRRDYRDMIWHTGGDTWLIDGETNPHVLRGIGSEDLFGHSFGMYPDMSEWTGAPHVVGLNADCSEVVAYRFFGADSVTFNSSLSLRFGTRANDMESVLYYYKSAESDTTAVETPQEWTLSGPFDCQTWDELRSRRVSGDACRRVAGRMGVGRAQPDRCEDSAGTDLDRLLPLVSPRCHRQHGHAASRCRRLRRDRHNDAVGKEGGAAYRF